VKLVKGCNPINNSMPERDVRAIQDKEVHELSSVTRAETTVVDTLGLVVELEMDCVDFQALDERLFRFRSTADGRVIFEFEKARDEIQCILIDVKTEGQYGHLCSCQCPAGAIIYHMTYLDDQL
jgi:hypothetical protein